MGAQQSSAGDQHQDTGGGGSKTCYYELLGVERLATDHEIKKAYRKKALELHPDRNINDVATATKRFAEVQAAYEVLSDAQERAWYDAHRDAILSGQDGSGEGAEPTTFRNVRLTTTEEILALMRKFNAAVPFDDEPTGFFGIARETFEHLALEEEAASDFEGIDCPGYPTFGSSSDSYETVVRQFYAAWAGFSTKKSFSWKDKYHLGDAPDRRVRRLMEKENKKSRDEAAREFNDAVRFLVSFVRKRDPRYLPNTQTDADRQRSLRVAAAAQAARSRAANREKYTSYEVPEWARTRADDSEQNPFSEGEEEEEVEILECVVCNKTFKSDKQLEAHERSKKHVKALQQLRRQMRKEGADLDLDVETTDSGCRVEGGDFHEEMTTLPTGEENPVQNHDDGAPIPASSLHDDGRLGGHKEMEHHRSGSTDESMVSPDSNNPGGETDSEDYAPRNIVESRLASDLNSKPVADISQVGIVDDVPGLMQGLCVEDTESQTKIGKAKAKRQKKAALQKQQQQQQHRCAVCRATFVSRNNLFSHIQEEGHAAAVPKVAGVSVGKNKKK